MITEFKQIEGLFEDISKELQTKVHCFVLGGAMLLYHGMKTVTKDIDLVVEKRAEFSAMEIILKEMGFKARIPDLQYKNLNLSQIYVRDDFRIDLFHRTICKGFSISPGMIQRSLQVLAFENLTVSLCSKEDVFMLKTLTEREGDLDDCISLASAGINWDSILQELKDQMQSSGNKIWITFVGERLDLLQERGLDIPIMNEVDQLRLQYYEELEKKLG